ncbi:hypothetical protein [Zavarzinella formosa]|uniref:hypothetical protein n=1 Tax=Zavarzinella formosa TaxID=360055 RepID=UPI0003018358|nr:hypothetical protein [Zavarzinella formosa]
MAYHMRFFDTSPKPLTITAVETALRVTDPTYRLVDVGENPIPQASLFLGDAPQGELEINTPGDGVFDNLVKEMLARLANSGHEFREAVETTLTMTQRIITVRISAEEASLDDTLAAIDPLWDWLFDSRQGLLHAEGEGYYEDGEMVLEEEE